MEKRRGIATAQSHNVNATFKKMIKTHRLYKCNWKGDEIIKTPINVNENTYKAIHENKFKQVDKQFANHWFEEYPYKWFEFHGLKVFFKNIRNRIKIRYAKNASVKLYIRDVSIVVIGGLIIHLVIQYFKKK